MSQNERQYKVTNGQIAKLQAALDSARATRESMAPAVYAATVTGIESQIAELREQLNACDELCRPDANA